MNSRFYGPINVILTKSTLDSLNFSVKGMEYKTGLIGGYQLLNLGIVFRVLALISRKYKITGNSVSKGLAQVCWRGRMEVISKKPLVIVDGAHNEDGFNEMLANVKEFKRKSILLTALSTDKDFSILLPLARMFKKVVITQGSFKPEDPFKIAQYLEDNEIDAVAFKSVKEACDYCKEELGEKDFLLAAGSLYMIPKVIQEFSI